MHMARMTRKHCILPTMHRQGWHHHTAFLQSAPVGEHRQHHLWCASRSGRLGNYRSDSCAYVDDTMLGKSNSGDLSYDDLIGRLQLISQTWERLLSYSGGALNLSKCFYYVLYWEWPEGLPVLRTSSLGNPTIVLTSGSSTSVSTIKRLDPNTASRTLGFFLRPTSEWTTQIEVLKK